MRCKALTVLLVFCLAQACPATEETLHDFVVGVSPTGTVELDDFTVTRENRLSLDINVANSGASQKSLNPNDIRVGDKLEIKGDFKSDTRQLKVNSVKLLSVSGRKLDITVFSDKMPELDKTPAGWKGFIFAEGMRIQVTESTALTYHKKHTIIKDARSGTDVEIVPKTFALTSLDGIGSDTLVHVQGVARDDGTVLATRVDLEDFELRPGEIKLMQKLAPTIQKGDALIHQPDELHVGRNKFKLLPDQDAHDYLQKLGESLVHLGRRELPADDSLKLSYLASGPHTDFTEAGSKPDRDK